MEDENDFKKLPTEEKCVHKLWKARVQGYEEAIKLFNKIDDEKSPEWSKYLGLIKKFVTDSNAVAQEKGMEAALVFVENCGHAGKTTAEVMSGIVSKCIGAPKTKTKDLALQITLMYIEIEKPDVVQEELIKGMEHKNPKIVAACINATTTALKQFGNKVFGIKPLVKKIPLLLADRDKSVRDEGKAMVVEMHRWIGAAIEPHIASLQPVQQQELKDMFQNTGTAKPTRYIKSQQAKAEAAASYGDDGDGGEVGGDDNDAGDAPDGDPYDLIDPVDILSKLPKDFYEKLEASKWQERKEALDSLEGLLKNSIKLESGDYADLVRALKKVISKDTNVMLVALSGRLLASVANGLRNKFQPYAVACTSAILEKFKEKKVNVVTALREAIDAIYPCTNLEAIQEDVLEAFNNKNPSVKSETALFLARAWSKTQPTALNKKILKAYAGGLVALLENAELTVREAGAEALGTATKLLGEKALAPYVESLDNLKQQKIKEAAEKAVIVVKISGPKKEARPKSGASQPPSAGAAPKAGSTQPKPVKRPGTGSKKPGAGGVKKSTSSGKVAGAASKSQPVREQELSPEEVDLIADEIFTQQLMQGLADSNWKNRLSSIQTFASTVQGLTPDTQGGAQLLLRALNKKPGLKDTNIQVLKIRLDIVKNIAENFPLTMTAVESVLEDVVEKLGDSKCSSQASEALMALAEHSSLESVVNSSLEYAMDKQKNPKVQAELFTWLSNAIKEFGFNLNIKSLMAHCKKAITAINPSVRTSAIAFLGVLSLYVGPSIINHFDGEKSALKQQITSELDKYANDRPPTPTRGVAKSASKGSIGDDLDEEASPVAAADETMDNNEEVLERTDITQFITESLINELNDKNWKVRNEALEKIKNIITNSSPIKPSLGELPSALAARMLDSNSKLAQMALSICESLAGALGVKCKNHARTFLPGFFQGMGDSKSWVRTAAQQCVERWCTESNCGAALALHDEVLFDALRQASTQGRGDILAWLSESLPAVSPKSFPREELTMCVPLLYASIEDRNSDVRKRASDCVLAFMLHLGYESMHKLTEKLKPGSKNVVLAALDKARPNLPVQPLPSKTKKEEKTVKSGGAAKKEAEKKPTGKVKGIVKPSSGVKSKKDEEESNMPLLPNNNTKNQRIIDDQKLKVLKWNFTVPREEFFELLKDQMTTAGINKLLITNMFHSDFRYHLKAIESLSDDVTENGTSLIANLDLILKWLTLRFFDTNPSVILKGLEYLSTVFNYLIEEDYTLAEYEAGCFIPYLVMKVGDPKDSVRNGVKALFKQICVVYSVTKLFGYLMEGLKSKNARQRTECLECICLLLECYGSSVMCPSAGIALKEIARHIGDRDNAVRSAALNTVTHAFFLEGEKVYKMIGQISDKDLSLLEERIKRAAKTRSAENRKSALIPLTATGKHMNKPPVEIDTPKIPHTPISVDQQPMSDEDEPPPPQEKPWPQTVTRSRVAAAATVEPQSNSPTTDWRGMGEGDDIKTQEVVVTGPFGLNPDLLAELDAQKAMPRRQELKSLDISFLDEPTTGVLPRMKIPSSIPSIPSSIQPSGQQSNEDQMLADTIHSIGSPNLNVAIRAMSLLHAALESGRGAALSPDADERLLRAAAAQVKLLRSRNPSQEMFSGYKFLVTMLNAFFERGNCTGAPSAVAVGCLLPELLKVLSCKSTIQHGGDSVDFDKLVRILNNICVRVLDKCDHTALLCSLVALLEETIGVTDPQYPRYQELLMKCFWKVLKMINTWDINSIDYDSVLLKIHHFYKAYPNSYWKKNAQCADTAYRTIKTLVHTLTKMKGACITQHLIHIPDYRESELYQYIDKVIKQLKLEEKKENICTEVETRAGQTPASNIVQQQQQQYAYNTPDNRAVHEELSHILRKLSGKEHAADAMMQLYQLKERNPNIDIWSYMKGHSTYFKDYIERGLRDVAERRKILPNPYTLPVNITNSPMIADVNNDNDDEKTHLYHMEKLRVLKARAGLEMNPTIQSRTPITDTNKMLLDNINDNNKAHHFDPQLELHPSQPLSQRNEGGVDALRQKLQQIKSSSKR